MWDMEIWRGRFSTYTPTQLVDLIQRHGVDDPLSLLADAELAKRVEAAEARLQASE
jgi:hypothetical protein